jgi:DNA-binding MarR family transcriptional regulator
MKPVTRRTARDSDYRALAEFRFHIRRYLDFSDQAAKRAGMEPKQYQLLLAIRGLPEGREPTVGVIAHELHLRHHSAVELVDRAERNRLVKRVRSGTHVFVRLSRKGDRVLADAVEKRLHELQTAGPLLVKALQRLIRSGSARAK